MTSIRSLRRLVLVLLAAALGGCCILPFGPGPGGHGPGGGGHGGPGGEFSGPPEAPRDKAGVGSAINE